MGDDGSAAPFDELERLHARHPWAPDVLALGRPLEYLWHHDVPAPPSAVWPYVADNSRFARAFGARPMAFEEKGGVLHGRGVYGGWVHEWIEEPWQWIAEREFVQVRDYARGPAHLMRLISRLEPLAGGAATRLHVYYGFVPRNRIGAAFLRYGFPRIQAGYDGAVRRLVAGLGAPVERVFAAPPAPIGEASRARVDAIRAALRERGVDAALLDRTIEHLLTTDDLAAYRIQVRRLAGEWSVDERALLEVFLHATRAGLVELSWDVMCPHCRGVRQEAATLADVEARTRCEVCAIDFETSAEHAVEVTFHVHPSIRRVDRVFYCSAEPATRAHIKVQQHLAAGERREVATALGPGRYRVRARIHDPVGDARGASALLDGAGFEVVAGGGDPAAPARVGFAIGGGLEHGRLAAAPVFALHNPGAAPATIAIEEPAWADDALRPGQLFDVQAFRDLFGEEYLGAAVQLHVGEQTILFTDIVGSTRYYSEVGDPAAFVAVKRHFAAVFAAIRAAGGAVVKTIGDAVMAAFAEPRDALAAALEIHRRLDGGPEAAAPVRLRISLNRGPCIAVNLNSGIDYFGSTVNTAAKLQRCAEAGEIAIGPALWAAPGVRAWLDERAVEMRETTLTHEAFGELAVHVVRAPS